MRTRTSLQISISVPSLTSRNAAIPNAAGFWIFSGIPAAVHFNFDGIPVGKRSRLFLFVHFVLNIPRFAAYQPVLFRGGAKSLSPVSHGVGAILLSFCGYRW